MFFATLKNDQTYLNLFLAFFSDFYYTMRQSPAEEIPKGENQTKTKTTKKGKQPMNELKKRVEVEESSSSSASSSSGSVGRDDPIAPDSPYANHGNVVGADLRDRRQLN